MSEQLSRTERILGAGAMARLRRSRVAVFGAGGVGGFVIEALSRSGLGALDIIDSDTVALSNLNRQIIATRSTVGRLKVDAFAERIADGLAPTERNRAIFLSGVESHPDVARHVAGNAVPKTGGIVAVCYGEGDGGFRYVLASARLDLRSVLPSVNAALAGRGGGKPGMAEGSFGADRDAIETFFSSRIFD